MISNLWTKYLISCAVCTKQQEIVFPAVEKISLAGTRSPSYKIKLALKKQDLSQIP